MKTKLIATIVGMAAFAASAETGISGVIVRQQWPWNGKVNIDYILTGEEGSQHDITVTLRNGSSVITNEYGSLSGDLIGVTPGARRIVWDPAYPTNNSPSYAEALMVNFSASLSTADDDNTYMIVDLSKGTSATSEDPYPVSFMSAPPAEGWTDEYKTDKLVLRRIPAGTALLGSPGDEVGHNDYWETQRRTTFTNSFYMAIFETTQKQFENVMGYVPASIPASGKDDMKPVSFVEYQLLRGTNVNAMASAAATSFFGVLTSKLSAALSTAGLGDYEMELPTISQWEYACRAGTTGSYNNGTTIAADTETDPNADLLAWYGGTVWNYAEVVGQKLQNAFGLYDMHGNVGEFTRDKIKNNVTIWDGTDKVEPLLDVDGGTYCLYLGGCRYQSNLAIGAGAKGVRSSSAANALRGTGSAQRGFRIALTRKR